MNKIKACGTFRPQSELKRPDPIKDPVDIGPYVIYGQNKFALSSVKKTYEDVDEYADRLQNVEDLCFDMVKEFSGKIKLNFQYGDKIMCYDDFDVSPPLCGSEFDLHVRGSEVLDCLLLRIS